MLTWDVIQVVWVGLGIGLLLGWIAVLANPQAVASRLNCTPLAAMVALAIFTFLWLSIGIAAYSQRPRYFGPV